MIIIIINMFDKSSVMYLSIYPVSPMVMDRLNAILWLDSFLGL